ncbi:MAG: UDP-N-acetylmuramate dehydrogenase [Patescibacteria group bacterium]|nr:UDP-N-acetylmuramate dehydrogenase [Patescibacteria group bacterium]
MIQLAIQENKDITHLFTLRIRTVAQYYFEARTAEDLFEVKKYSMKNQLPLLIVGGGSNIAPVSKVFNGLVVKNNYQEIKIIAQENDHVIVSVSSGYPASLLVAKSLEHGWGGLEYHLGLPGTIGGAIYMNSKWTKPPSYFGDHLIEALLINNKGNLKRVDRDYFSFAYDFSILQKTKEILVEAIFRLRKDDKKKLKERGNFALAYRKKTQPNGVASSGCFFQNHEGISAGYLIDQVGLKGFKIGQLLVSPVHANFIVNEGEGRQEDLLKLIAIIKKKVRDKFGINLIEEVILA